MKNTLKTIAFSIPFILLTSEKPKEKTNNFEGRLLIENSEFNFPEFPKATFYNESDTFEYQGNHMGEIQYNLPKGKYNIKIEPGTDSLQNLKGEEFTPYKTQIQIPTKSSLEKISRQSQIL